VTPSPWKRSGDGTTLQQELGTAVAHARKSGARALEEDALLTALFLWTLESTDKSLTTEDTENTEEEQDEEEEDSVALCALW